MVSDRRHSSFLHAGWGFGVGAIVFAFLASPLLRYADAQQLASCGLLLGVAIMALYFVDVNLEKPSAFAYGIAGTLLIAGIIYTAHLHFAAADAAAANDRRCLAVQRDMLSARPKRSDGADLFQALGCRPQGEGSVYVLPRRNAS